MCQYCSGIISHDSRCPLYNEAQDDTGLTCADCGESIKKYDRYVHVSGKAYHADCLDCMDIESLIQLLGYEMEGEE